MSRVTVMLGTSNSQPVGTEDGYIEELYQRAYKPFLRALYNAPRVRATLHYSGTLLQWMERRHSEFADVVGEMVSRRQIELLGGGFYDPVLTVIPRSDRLGQIERMTTYLRKRFGRRPRGAWITEQVWEPSLPSLLKTSGMDYTFLADYHFRAAGLIGGEVVEPCITEDEGKTVLVFPLARELAGSVHELSPEAFVESIRAAGEESSDAVVVVIIPGESLGLNQQDHDRFFGQGWFRDVFKLLEEEEDLEATVPWRFLRGYAPRRRAYFPSTSYEEMMCWVLPPERRKRFEGLRDQLGDGSGNSGFLFGGFFRHFLTRYTESNRMYAKMQYTHILVNQVRGDKYRKQLAREELWRGQCNGAYWHGRAGGIYINRLRKSVYASLIEAEKVTREKGIFKPSIMRLDFDMDGRQEYLYQGHDINAYVHPIGGTLFELDYLPVPWNYLDTMARHPEAYHSSDVVELGYDDYPREAFVDHFLSADSDIGAFEGSRFGELGDFVGEQYETEEYRRDDHELHLLRNGHVVQYGDSVPVTLRKRFHFGVSDIEVRYELTNDGNETLACVFAPEVNLSFMGDGSDDQLIRVSEDSEAGQTEPGSFQRSTHASAQRVRLSDQTNGVDVTLSLDEAAELWTFPVVTYAFSETEVYRYYQSSCLVPRWPLDLPPGDSWGTRLTLSLSHEG